MAEMASREGRGVGEYESGGYYTNDMGSWRGLLAAAASVPIVLRGKLGANNMGNVLPCFGPPSFGLG